MRAHGGFSLGHLAGPGAGGAMLAALPLAPRPWRGSGQAWLSRTGWRPRGAAAASAASAAASKTEARASCKAPSRRTALLTSSRVTTPLPPPPLRPRAALSSPARASSPPPPTSAQSSRRWRLAAPAHSSSLMFPDPSLSTAAKIAATRTSRRAAARRSRTLISPPPEGSACAKMASSARVDSTPSAAARGAPWVSSAARQRAVGMRAGKLAGARAPSGAPATAAVRHARRLRSTSTALRTASASTAASSAPVPATSCALALAWLASLVPTSSPKATGRSAAARRTSPAVTRFTSSGRAAESQDANLASRRTRSCTASGAGPPPLVSWATRVASALALPGLPVRATTASLCVRTAPCKSATVNVLAPALRAVAMSRSARSPAWASSESTRTSTSTVHAKEDAGAGDGARRPAGAAAGGAAGGGRSSSAERRKSMNASSLIRRLPAAPCGAWSNARAASGCAATTRCHSSSRTLSLPPLALASRRATSRVRTWAWRSELLAPPSVLPPPLVPAPLSA